MLIIKGCHESNASKEQILKKEKDKSDYLF